MLISGMAAAISVVLSLGMIAPQAVGRTASVTEMRAAQTCSLVEIKAGKCPVGAQITEKSVDLTATLFNEGQDTRQRQGRSSGDGSPSRVNGVTVKKKGLCPDDLKPCANFPALPAPAKPPVPGTPAVTLADIASFRPVPVPPASEPNGWGVVGLDTNFVSSDSSQIVTGTLLGRPASVRFTPVAYGWSYGDGASRVSTSPGGTWQALRLREFDPTPSSHAYRATGDYSARVVVQYAAEYSWGDPAGFTPIDGTVTAAADPVPIHIVTESTVLVGNDCTVTPSGPGC